MKKGELTPVDIRQSAVEARLVLARTWKKRTAALLKSRQKKDPKYSEARFCETHGFDAGFFNRIKNIKVVPTQRTVDAVERALRKEGV